MAAGAFRDVRIVWTDKFGFTQYRYYVRLSGSELKEKINEVRSEPWYHIAYIDITGCTKTIEKASD